MGDYVAVRMTGEAARMVEPNAAEDEGNAVRERVRVDAEPDAQVAHPSSACRASR